MGINFGCQPRKAAPLAGCALEDKMAFRPTRLPVTDSTLWGGAFYVRGAGRGRLWRSLDLSRHGP
jgi:hypothetical protein